MFGVLYARSLCLLLYGILIGTRYVSYGLKTLYRRHWQMSTASLAYTRKARMYIHKCRHIAGLHLTVSLLFLLLLCGDIHSNPGPVLPGSKRHPNLQFLTVAAWNVRTLVESKRTPIRPTAIVARELDRYGIDIAALGETRILGENVIEECGGGYTFFLKGKPLGDKHHHGVGFAMRTRLVKHLNGKFPLGINERLMTMSFPLDGSNLSIISAYAPTLPQSDEIKDSFYDSLSDAIGEVPSSHKLLVMGDFNARVGSDHTSWESIIGRHGVGNENSNGTRLLSLCAQNELCITNTFFQQATRHKTTWMQPWFKTVAYDRLCHN